VTEKIAIITGTSSGLGLAMATSLLERGFFVYGGSRTEAPIEHENYVDIELDLRDEKSVISFYKEIAAETEVVDLLVNSAGVCEMNSFSETTSEEFLDHIETNLMGSFYLYKYFEPFIISEETSIFNIQSISSKYIYPNTSSYTTTEFGKRGLIDTVLKEWSKYKVRRANFYVGAVETPLWHKYTDIDTDKMLTTKDFVYMFESIVDSPSHIQFPEITFLHRDGFLD
jgi:NAD(P)-dependent dehydrogenase (short-subunit alcohol dehydrogenase family)